MTCGYAVLAPWHQVDLNDTIAPLPASPLCLLGWMRRSPLINPLKGATLVCNATSSLPPVFAHVPPEAFPLYNVKGKKLCCQGCWEKMMTCVSSHVASMTTAKPRRSTPPPLTVDPGLLIFSPRAKGPSLLKCTFQVKQMSSWLLQHVIQQRDPRLSGLAIAAVCRQTSHSDRGAAPASGGGGFGRPASQPPSHLAVARRTSRAVTGTVFS